MRRPAGWHLFGDGWRSYLLTGLLAAVLLFVVGSVPPGGGLFDGAVFSAGATVKVDLMRSWWLSSVPLFAALFVQHRWPLPAAASAAAGIAGHLYLPPLLSLIDFVATVILFTVANRARSRWLTVAVTGTLAAGVILGFLFLTPKAPLGRAGGDAARVEPAGTEGAKPSDSEPRVSLLARTAADGMAMVLILASGAALGDGARARRQYQRMAEQRAADLELDRRRQIELATAAERARISRELHDVVAHSLTVIVAQAQAATAARQRRPERSSAAMDEVVTTGRAALAEMRRLLGSVAGPADDREPGLGALSELLDRVRAAGTPVRLGIEGQPVPLPAPVDLTAYRIVQEALTNTLKHAGPGARADVRLAFGTDRVDVEVTDDGADPVPGGPVASGRGNGLRGIAERVDLLGGQLDVGPRAEGGFRVRARLRLVDEAVAGG